MKQRFEDWYAEQVTTQFDGSEMESTDLEPISLSLPILKELGAKWLVQMANYFTDNPQIIVNGFVKAGITAALDGQENQQEEMHVMEDDSEDDFEIISSGDDDNTC